MGTVGTVPLNHIPSKGYFQPGQVYYVWQVTVGHSASLKRVEQSLVTFSEIHRHSCGGCWRAPLPRTCGTGRASRAWSAIDNV